MSKKVQILSTAIKMWVRHLGQICLQLPLGQRVKKLSVFLSGLSVYDMQCFHVIDLCVVLTHMM